MVGKTVWSKAVEKAYDKVEHFRADQFRRTKNEFEPRSLLSSDPTGRTMLAVDFARFCAGTPVYPFSQLPEPGFASWLVRLPIPAIAVDWAQLDAWAGEAQVPVDVLVARTILHEVGHVLLQPGMLGTEYDASGNAIFVATADPADENIAWIFALTVLTLGLGDYSEACKRMRDSDDTPKVLI